MKKNVYKDGSPLEFGNPEHIKWVHKISQYFDKTDPLAVCELSLFSYEDGSITCDFKCPICEKTVSKDFDYEEPEFGEFEDEDYDNAIYHIKKRGLKCDCGQHFIARAPDPEFEDDLFIYCKHPKR